MKHNQPGLQKIFSQKEKWRKMWFDEPIGLGAARSTVKLYQRCPAVPLHLPNLTEPQASSQPAE